VAEIDIYVAPHMQGEALEDKSSRRGRGGRKKTRESDCCGEVTRRMRPLSGCSGMSV